MDTTQKSNRGLANASRETRLRVAKTGGDSPHAYRGLQAADEATRKRVASMGGAAPHVLRGAAATQQKREATA